MLVVDFIPASIEKVADFKSSLDSGTITIVSVERVDSRLSDVRFCNSLGSFPEVPTMKRMSNATLSKMGVVVSN